jgi:hypothetical protein
MNAQYKIQDIRVEFSEARQCWIVLGSHNGEYGDLGYQCFVKEQAEYYANYEREIRGGEENAFQKGKKNAKEDKREQENRREGMKEILLLTAGSKKLVVAGLLNKGAGFNDVKVDFTAFRTEEGNLQRETKNQGPSVLESASTGL